MTQKTWVNPNGLHKEWVTNDRVRINFRTWRDRIRVRGTPDNYAVISHIWLKPLDGGKHGHPYEYQVWVVPHFPGKDPITQVPFVAMLHGTQACDGQMWLTVAENMSLKEACEFRSSYFQFVQ